MGSNGPWTQAQREKIEALWTPERRREHAERRRKLARLQWLKSDTRERLMASRKSFRVRPSRGAVMLQSLLGRGWVLEHIVTGGFMRGGLRIDVACPSLKLAIEVDGPSHDNETSRMRDAARDEFLRARGWTVFRVREEHVQEALDGII